MTTTHYPSLEAAGIKTSALPSQAMLQRAIEAGSRIKQRSSLLANTDPTEDVLAPLAGKEPGTGNIFFKALCKRYGGVYRYGEALGVAKQLPLMHELAEGRTHLHEVTFIPDADGNPYLFANYAVSGPDIIVQLMRPGFPEKYRPRARIVVPWDKPDQIMRAFKEAKETYHLTPIEAAGLASSISHAAYLYFAHSGGGELHSPQEDIASRISEDFHALALAHANEDKSAQAAIERKHGTANFGMRFMRELPGRIVSGFGRGKEKETSGGEVVPFRPKSDEAFLAP